LGLSCWKITSPFHNSVAGWYLSLRETQEAPRWVRNRFGLEVECEATYQRGNLVDHIRTVFLPNLAKVRALDEFAEEMAVLLMDHWSSHITGDMVALLMEERVCIITFAPNTTKIFQVFDVTLFDALTRHPKCELAFGREDVTVSFLRTVYHGFKQITVDFNRCGPF
jgi:hypothetical protein